MLRRSIAQKLSDLDLSLVEDKPEEELSNRKKSEKWLLAAAFGTGGSTKGHGKEFTRSSSEASSVSAGWDRMGSGNQYAVNMSPYVKSFYEMSKDEFTKYSHLPPFSFGLTARKNYEKGVGLESGLVYTYLSSHFVWLGYEGRQNLHYLGIPVNLVVNLWNKNPNWQIYFSGGFTVEKGVRAIYRQERRTLNEHRITTVSSSIPGLQWSFGGGLGVNYKLENGWGLYFEPRAGYSIGSDQPVSVRTEYPVYIGINLGLNWELGIGN